MKNNQAELLGKNTVINLKNTMDFSFWLWWSNRGQIYPPTLRNQKTRLKYMKQWIWDIRQQATKDIDLWRKKTTEVIAPVLLLEGIYRCSVGGRTQTKPSSFI